MTCLYLKKFDKSVFLVLCGFLIIQLTVFNATLVIAQEESAPPETTGDTGSTGDTASEPADDTGTDGTDTPTDETTTTDMAADETGGTDETNTDTDTTGDANTNPPVDGTDQTEGDIPIEAATLELGAGTGTEDISSSSSSSEEENNAIEAGMVIIGGSSGGVTSQTSLTSGRGDDLTPEISVKWEMTNIKNDQSKFLGVDDSTASNTQLLPSGQFQVDKTVVVCAVASDPDGVADINGVYAGIYYPEKIALGLNHPVEKGCGKILGTEFQLNELSKDDGFNLLCDQIKNNNNNLPTFLENISYDSVCAPDGVLMKETSRVYCGEKNLSYEDPAGDYKVIVYAQDKSGDSSAIFANTFKYLELTAFTTDFDYIDYGQVRLNTAKLVSGDLFWDEPIATNPATVRNLGNTRLRITVKQNDFGLGKTDSSWNVRYRARIGSSAEFSNYWPEMIIALDKVLDLSETNEMDFEIEVFKFPPGTGNVFSGQMTILAEKAEQLQCE